MMTYLEVINGINSGKLEGIKFYIQDYPHYNNCKIIRKEDVLPNGNVICLIEVFLTQDRSEHVSFYKTFKEDVKIFDLGRKGRFTLRQIWNRVTIQEILPKSL